LRLVANLSDKDTAYSDSGVGTSIWGATGDRLAPWSVVWRLGG